jgi:hypothetical protein
VSFQVKDSASEMGPRGGIQSGYRLTHARGAQRQDPWRGLLRQVVSRLDDHPYWSRDLNGFSDSRRGLHLAVLDQQTLSLVLFGVKNLEVRSLRTTRPPFELISRSDVVLLKGRGGPVSGVTRVSRVWMFSGLTPDDWSRLDAAMSTRSDVSSNDWSSLHDSRTKLTLLALANTCTFPVPIEYEKSDPRVWAVLKEPRRPILASRYVSPSDVTALSRRTPNSRTKP